MTIRRVILAAVAAVVLAGGGFAAYAWHPAIDPVQPPAASGFQAELVRQGAALAAIGNCGVCHTAPGGAVLAGGLAMPTPFGTVYSTNITPDAETGIGRWSEAAFTRAMRAGLDREGRHLYPAFPYDHFTQVSDADNRALYAYLMTRAPVSAQAPPNALPFPLNQRWLLAGWKLLFFREARFEPDATRDAAWNRGAYLAEGLGHCGACHTPRNALGAERRQTAYWAGAEVEGWHAYALNAASPAAVPWDEASLADYLRQGWQAQHGIARGPMAPVVGNLASVAEDETRAIARYVASVMGTPSAERLKRGAAALERARPVSAQSASPQPTNTQPAGARPTVADSQTTAGAPGNDPGAAIYAAACATCHAAGRPLPFGGLPLALSTGVTGPTPQNLLNVILDGLPASGGDRAPIMPGFRGTLGEAQLVALLRYLRTGPGDTPPWPEVEVAVRDALSKDRAAASRPMVATRAAPADAARP